MQTNITINSAPDFYIFMKSDEYETTTFFEDIIYTTTIAPKMHKEFLSVRQTIKIRKEFPETWIFLTSEKYEEFCFKFLKLHITYHIT